jgi:hypothetical protein
VSRHAHADDARIVDAFEDGTGMRLWEGTHSAGGGKFAEQRFFQRELATPGDGTDPVALAVQVHGGHKRAVIDKHLPVEGEKGCLTPARQTPASMQQAPRW